MEGGEEWRGRGGEGREREKGGKWRVEVGIVARSGAWRAEPCSVR